MGSKKKVLKPVNPKGKTRAVVLCTEHRGVFYGQTDAALDAVTATLHGMRNCVYWDKIVGGVVGLAEVGPSGQCRIGKKLNKPAGIRDITAIFECTDAAIGAWETFPCLS